MTRALALSLLLLPLSACGSLDVSLPGRLGTPLLARESPDGPLVWACDRLGNLTLNGRVLHLPTRAELARFGVTVVDTRPLPPAWRPDHVPQGGLLVTGLDMGSPLALAGLRPLDRIDAVDGAPMDHPEELVAALSVPPGKAVQVAFARPDGALATLTAEAVDGPRDAQTIRVPLLFERRHGSAGGAFGFGPLDALFYWRDAATHGWDADPGCGHSRYGERFEWGALANLILWERATLPDGQSKARLRLLWLFSFGDDVP